MPDKSYIREDEQGVKRVGQTRVMLDSVIAAFEQGHSAETIAQQYPAVTLEDKRNTTDKPAFAGPPSMFAPPAHVPQDDLRTTLTARRPA